MPTVGAALQWLRGIGRDPDMTGVVALMLFIGLVSAAEGRLAGA